MYVVILLLVLPACSPADVEPPSPENSPPPAPSPWHLVGLADDSHMPLPALASGRELLGTACYTANQRIAALGTPFTAPTDPPAAGPPCGVEEWSDGSSTFRLLWAGSSALIAERGVDRRAPLLWHLDGALDACLGPPLNLPPAGDPGGTRTTDGEAWLLVFSGANRCGLTGSLRLWIRADRSDPGELTVEGRAWRSGGAELAAARLDGR